MRYYTLIHDRLSAFGEVTELPNEPEDLLEFERGGGLALVRLLIREPRAVAMVTYSEHIDEGVGVGIELPVSEPVDDSISAHAEDLLTLSAHTAPGWSFGLGADGRLRIATTFDAEACPDFDAVFATYLAIGVETAYELREILASLGIRTQVDEDKVLLELAKAGVRPALPGNRRMAMAQGMLVNRRMALAEEELMANRRMAMTAASPPNRRMALATDAPANRRMALASEVLGNRRMAMAAEVLSNRRMAMSTDALSNRRMAMAETALANRRMAMVGDVLANRRMAMIEDAASNRRMAMIDEALANRRMAMADDVSSNRRMAMSTDALSNRRMAMAESLIANRRMAASDPEADED